MKYCSCMCTSKLPTSDVPYEKSQHEKAATPWSWIGLCMRCTFSYVEGKWGKSGNIFMNLKPENWIFQHIIYQLHHLALMLPYLLHKTSAPCSSRCWEKKVLSGWWWSYKFMCSLWNISMLIYYQRRAGLNAGGKAGRWKVDLMRVGGGRDSTILPSMWFVYFCKMWFR